MSAHAKIPAFTISRERGLEIRIAQEMCEKYEELWETVMGRKPYCTYRPASRLFVVIDGPRTWKYTEICMASAIDSLNARLNHKVES